MKIVIIDYGAGNIQSIMFAIKRLGYEAVLSHEADEIRNADKVIFPGVGQGDSNIKATCFGHLFGYAVDVPFFQRRQYRRFGHL